MPQKCSLFHVIIIYFRMKTCTLIEDSFCQFIWHYQTMSGLRLFQYTKFCFSILRQIFIFSQSASDCARSTRWIQSYYIELLTQQHAESITAAVNVAPSPTYEFKNTTQFCPCQVSKQQTENPVWHTLRACTFFGGVGGGWWCMNCNHSYLLWEEQKIICCSQHCTSLNFLSRTCIHIPQPDKAELTLCIY